jgi:hypothetical protein
MRYWHWAIAVLLSVGLAACGSGGSGFGPPPGGGSGTKATARVTVLSTFTNPQPLSNVHVLGEGETAPTLTGPDGQATVTVPTGQAARLFLQFPEGSQNIYPLTVPAGLPTVEATLFANPIAATTSTPGVMIMPTGQAPAGPAEILAPPDGATILCAPPPAECRVDVYGQASIVLGQPGSPFFVYVAVTPLSLAGGDTFLHVPPAPVDPVTGFWQSEVHLGGAGSAAVQPGDMVQIVAIVTDALWTSDTTPTPVQVPSPEEIPGVVYISRVITLQIGAF